MRLSRSGTCQDNEEEVGGVMLETTGAKESMAERKGTQGCSRWPTLARGGLEAYCSDVVSMSRLALTTFTSLMAVMFLNPEDIPVCITENSLTYLSMYIWTGLVWALILKGPRVGTRREKRYRVEHLRHFCRSPEGCMINVS